jgi:hypothetical protein
MSLERPGKGRRLTPEEIAEADAINAGFARKVHEDAARGVKPKGRGLTQTEVDESNAIMARIHEGMNREATEAAERDRAAKEAAERERVLAAERAAETKRQEKEARAQAKQLKKEQFRADVRDFVKNLNPHPPEERNRRHGEMLADREAAREKERAKEEERARKKEERAKRTEEARAAKVNTERAAAAIARGEAENARADAMTVRVAGPAKAAAAEAKTKAAHLADLHQYLKELDAHREHSRGKTEPAPVAPDVVAGEPIPTEAEVETANGMLSNTESGAAMGRQVEKLVRGTKRALEKGKNVLPDKVRAALTRAKAETTAVDAEADQLARDGKLSPRALNKIQRVGKLLGEIATDKRVKISLAVIGACIGVTAAGTGIIDMMETDNTTRGLMSGVFKYASSYVSGVVAGYMTDKYMKEAGHGDTARAGGAVAAWLIAMVASILISGGTQTFVRK